MCLHGVYRDASVCMSACASVKMSQKVANEIHLFLWGLELPSDPKEEIIRF